MNREQRPHDRIERLLEQSGYSQEFLVRFSCNARRIGVNEKRTTCEGGCMASPTMACHTTTCTRVLIHTRERAVRGDAENMMREMRVSLHHRYYTLARLEKFARRELYIYLERLFIFYILNNIFYILNINTPAFYRSIQLIA